MLQALVEPLTDMEKRTLEVLTRRLERDTIVPSYDEICQAVGLKSRGYRIYSLLDSLEEKGYIERLAGQSRAIRVLYRSDGQPFRLGATVQVPVKGLIAAGLPINPQDGFDEVVELTADLVGDPLAAYALRVRGDSMIEDSVLDGDLVILRHQNTANNGDLVAAWLLDPGETTLKRYYREGRQIRLKPANPRYQDRIVDERNVQIQGKVVAVIRRLT